MTRMDPAAAERWIAGLDLMGMRFGLERMQALMDALGQPCRGIPSVHVVGTNGKTSVTRMTAAFLAAAGLRTGAYTSPHILGWRERVDLDGVVMPPDAFAAAATRVHAAVPGVPEGAITQFEAMTAVAFDALQRQLEEQRRIAVMNPSDEHLLAYMRLQRQVMDRAQIFATRWQRLVWQQPELDYGLQGRPTQAMAMDVFDRQQREGDARAIVTLAQDHGLVFFFRSDCPHC